VRYNDSGSLIMRWPTAEKTTPTVMSPFLVSAAAADGLDAGNTDAIARGLRPCTSLCSEVSPRTSLIL
jgi:hypothetical protein